MKRRVVVLIGALALACGAKEKPAAETAPAPIPRAIADTTTLPDPEPPDAQARAEAVVNAEFNRDKSKRLAMTIKPLIFRTSEVQGLASQLATRENNIDDTLARLAAKVTETEVVIRLPGAILFDFDSADIRADAERALSDVAQVIESYKDRPVRVEGHTDSIASDDYNQSLSERRATSVVEWLSGHGIARPRLTAAGHGETKPVATNDTAAGRQLNRRVEVVIARK